jgi:hypothetical protein
MAIPRTHPKSRWTKRFNVQIAPDDYEELGRQASLEGLSIACYVRILIHKELAISPTSHRSRANTSRDSHQHNLSDHWDVPTAR